MPPICWRAANSTIKLRELQKKAGANPDKKTALTVAYLCRAKGDLAGARKYAEKAEHPLLLQSILVEQEDWKALLNHIDKTPLPERNDSPKIGLRLACLRLLGDRDGFTAELNKAMTGEDAHIPQSAFLLNGRPDDALTWMTKKENHWGAAYLLNARLRLRQAIDTADQVRATAIMSYRLVKPQLLAHAGERKQALEGFEKLMTEPQDVGRRDRASPVVAAYHAGFRDEAFAHAAKLLPQLEQEDGFGIVGQMLDAVKREMPVELWWKFLGDKYPAEDGPAKLKRLRDLYENKTPAKDIAAWLKEMADTAATQKEDEREGTLALIVHSCRQLGRDDLLDGYLEKWAAVGKEARPWLLLGDRSAERKQWKEAAERYRHCWEKDRSAALPLYLRGRALVQAGDEKEGRRWMQIAEIMPLGSEDKLAAFAGGLTEHGLMDAAGRAWERLSRLALMPSIYNAAAARGMAEKAVAARDYLQAATWARRESLNYLSSPIYEAAYAHVLLLTNEHRYRARPLAAAGKLDDMRKEVDAVLAIVPDLEFGHRRCYRTDEGRPQEGGRRAVCPRLCRPGWGVQGVPEKRDGPQQHGLAGGALPPQSRCRPGTRSPGDELYPDISGHLDTLAEVLFQRGDKDKAIEVDEKVSDDGADQ